MEKKSNKGIIIALCTVIVVLIGTITYLFVSGSVNLSVKENKNKDKNKTEQKVEENKDKESEEKEEVENNNSKQLSLDDPLVQKLYGYISVDDGENVVQDVFSKYGVVTNRTVSDHVKFDMALLNDKSLGKQFKYVKTENHECGELKVYQLNSSVITNKINEMFGKDNGYSHSRVETGFMKYQIGMSDSMVGCVQIDYVANSNVYEASEMCGCGGMTDHSIYSKLVNAEKINDTIILTQKIYVYYFGNIYKTTDYRDIIANNVDYNDQANKEEYFEKGATTKYTFKLAEDGSYYFESKVTS